jgi:hypothetical protein
MQMRQRSRAESLTICFDISPRADRKHCGVTRDLLGSQQKGNSNLRVLGVRHCCLHCSGD